MTHPEVGVEVTIRDELATDVDAIRQLTIAAFSSSELGYHGEADLVDRLRESPATFISFVAEVDDAIVGHILFTPVAINGQSAQVHGLGLAPMSVAPEFQRRGIGTQLVRSALTQVRADGYHFVVVLGHPTFYSRFGFEPASTHGVSCEFPGVPDEVFRILLLSSDASVASGLARYRQEFSD